MENKPETELVNVRTGELSIGMERWKVMREQADVLVKSGFLPTAINTPEKCIMVMMKGQELGIGYIEALSSINIIQGKPTMAAQLMLAMARRSGELEDLSIEASDKGATVTIKRKGQSPYTSVFGIKEATDLQLIGKDNYKKQPATMFKWRAVSDNLRVTFGDAIAGLYSTEEISDGETTSARTPIYMPKAIEVPVA